jgi:hypothetical protein
LLEIDRHALLPKLRTTERTLALGALEAPTPKRKAKVTSKGKPEPEAKPAKRTKRARGKGDT